MNTVFKKMLVCICIILIFFNFILNATSLAATKSSDDIAGEFEEGLTDNEDTDTSDTITEITSGIVGILTWLPRIGIIGACKTIQVVGATVANMAGKIDGANSDIKTLTPDDILFNNILLTDINFFADMDSFGTDNVIRIIREQIAMWYYIIRNISIIILLVVLIFCRN